MQAAAANGVTCLEWGDLKISFGRDPDEDDDDFEPEDDDEEYVDDDALEELDFKSEEPAVNAPNPLEVPRPLQLNQEYDAWSAAAAPPVFVEE